MLPLPLPPEEDPEDPADEEPVDEAGDEDPSPEEEEDEEALRFLRIRRTGPVAAAPIPSGDSSELPLIAGS